jgi:hypothetical protein
MRFIEGVLMIGCIALAVAYPLPGLALLALLVLTLRKGAS